MKANPHERRIFTFGVGVDVNAPLLDKVAEVSRAASTYVLPGEDVEMKVAQVFRRLAGPVLSDAALSAVGMEGDGRPDRVSEILPSTLPDLFEGDQLVLLGRYTEDAPLGFVISGNYLGSQKRFRFSFDLDNATTRNAFVPRLWASRKIALLTDSIRDLGADGSAPESHDPRVRELVDEIVLLSTQFGVLTEYTAFLAREGTSLEDVEELGRRARDNFARRAIGVRSGAGAVNQSMNWMSQRRQSALNRSNAYLAPDMNRVSIATVQQVNDLAFYRRGDRWIDSRAAGVESGATPEKEIAFGSNEFRQLARRLASDNRQGAIALTGDVVIVVDGRAVLVRGPRAGQ